jgi:hypothetical protein
MNPLDLLRTQSQPSHILASPSEDKPSSAEARRKALLFQNQQDALRQERGVFYHLVPEFIECNRKLRACYQDGIIGQFHHGSWDSLWLAIEALSKLGTLYHRGTYLLAGWFAPFKETPDKIERTHGELFRDVLFYGAYKDVLSLYQAWQDTKEGSLGEEAAAVAYWEGIRNNPTPFEAAKVSPGEWSHEQVMALLKTRIPELERSIGTRLLFLENRCFIFYPQPDQTTSGWWAFWRFCHAYNHLPEDLRHSFGEYQWKVYLPTPPAP